MNIVIWRNHTEHCLLHPTNPNYTLCLKELHSDYALGASTTHNVACKDCLTIIKLCKKLVLKENKN
jgi:hypothetical protein